MERTNRLPSAPSRLPSVPGGVRVQTGHPSGLPKLFGRGLSSANDFGYSTHISLVPLVSPHDEVQNMEQNQEMSVEDQEWYSWIGKKVCISGVKKGILAFYGRTLFADGMFCGIHLDEPEGRHDGEFNGHRYFTCPKNHGVFAPVSKVERVLMPKLPPISSPIYVPDDCNRTFISGKSPGFCNINLNGTFSRVHSPASFRAGLNSTFLNTNSACVNETFSPIKSQSVESDLDRTYSIDSSPTSTYTIQKSTPFHQSPTAQAQSGQQTFTSDDPQFMCYDDDDSSLGLLTDSQMRDFSVDGLILPKTESCDDINELPEHEVVQDITVQYLDDRIPPCDSVPFHSTPLAKNDVKPTNAPLEGSISEDRSFSMLVDQELPCFGLDCTLTAVTEDTETCSVSVSDDATNAIISAEMPTEEIVPHDILEQDVTEHDLKELSSESSSDSEKNVSVLDSSVSIKPELSATSPGFVDIMTATGERITVSRDAVIGALVGSMSKKSNLPNSVLNKISNTLRDTDTGTMEITSVVVTNTTINNVSEVTSPTEVQLQEKSQRSLESSMTKSVEWNDIVMVQHTGEEFKEERLSIEKVMEVIQAKGQSCQRPASTYTVGSADTGYQGDGEFDLQSEIETSSPCEEMKPLVSPSVSTSLSLDEINGSLAGATGSCKMGKTDHLSDSDFFTEDPGETEEDVQTPSIMREEMDPPSESADDSIACGSVADDTLTEQAADVTFKVELQPEEAVVVQSTEAIKQLETTEPAEPVKEAVEESDIPKKSKKLPYPGPAKKDVRVSKVKMRIDVQPPIEPVKKIRTPKKSRWDAVTSKIQAGMAEEKVKPKKEVRGRVNTNLGTVRVAPPLTTKKTDSSPTSRRPSGNDGVTSCGPASTRSTPLTESVTLPADTDDTASQATTSARGASSCGSQRGSVRALGDLSSSTASACSLSSSSSTTSSHCSVPSSIPTRHKPPSLLGPSRMPSKIAVRFQPRLETVAKVSDPAKKTTRLVRSTTARTPPSPQPSKGLLHGPAGPRSVTTRTEASQSAIARPKAPALVNAAKQNTTKQPQPMKAKTVKGQSTRATVS